MPRTVHDTVYIYHGPGHQVPWAEICLRVGATHGEDALLELVITSKIVGETSDARIGARLLRGGPPADKAALGTSRQPTIRDVARMAGVCTSTVSRVVNRKTRVAHNTRLRVEEVIERLGFKPNEAAQNMVRSKRRAPENAGDAARSSLTAEDLRRRLDGTQEYKTEARRAPWLAESE